jgi:membrane protease YdiL (CAAX protease family)
MNRLRRLARSNPLPVALAAEGLLIPLALGLAWLLGQSPWADFRWPPGTLLLAVAFPAPLIALLGLFTALGPGWFRELENIVRPAVEALFRGQGRAAVILAALLAGFGEELLFRGVLQAWMAEGLGPWIGLGLAVIHASRAVSPWLGFVLVVAATAALVLAQGPFARWVGGLRPSGRPVPTTGPASELLGTRRVVAVDHDDVGFTGGWVGAPGREALLVPARWVRDLASDRLEAELVRRGSVLRTGARERGLVLAAAFDLIGFALAVLVLGGSLTSVAGLVTVSLWVTLWSFVGALILPSLSRPGVYGADRAASERGVDPAILRETARQLDRWQDDEPRRPRGVETIFHPIPAVEHRVEALDQRRPAGPGAWHTARVALWLSWASFGLLGRAVHCNCGRPELWVLLPAD